MSDDLVLDRVQLLFRAYREQRDTLRGRPARILVDPGGRIRISDPERRDEGPGLAEVKPDVFA